MASLAIDKADDAGNGATRKQLSKKDKYPVEKTRYDDVPAPKGFRVRNASRSFSRHSGIFVLLSDAGARSEFGLRDAGTEDGNADSCSLEFILQR